MTTNVEVRNSYGAVIGNLKIHDEYQNTVGWGDRVFPIYREPVNSYYILITDWLREVKPDKPRRKYRKKPKTSKQRSKRVDLLNRRGYFYIYGLFKDRKCFYVGVTHNPQHRMIAHTENWGECVMCILHVVSTIEEARRLETAEIAALPNSRNRRRTSTYKLPPRCRGFEIEEVPEDDPAFQ